MFFILCGLLGSGKFMLVWVIVDKYCDGIKMVLVDVYKIIFGV